MALKNGVKYDQGKPRWELFPWRAAKEIVKVLTYGAKKYDDDNWEKVPDARRRYFGAAIRHITAWWNGERDDPETGLHHLAHAACCLLFLLTFDLREEVREEGNRDCDSCGAREPNGYCPACELWVWGEYDESCPHWKGKPSEQAQGN